MSGSGKVTAEPVRAVVVNTDLEKKQLTENLSISNNYPSGQAVSLKINSSHFNKSYQKQFNSELINFISLQQTIESAAKTIQDDIEKIKDLVKLQNQHASHAESINEQVSTLEDKVNSALGTQFKGKKIFDLGFDLNKYFSGSFSQSNVLNQISNFEKEFSKTINESNHSSNSLAVVKNFYKEAATVPKFANIKGTREKIIELLGQSTGDIPSESIKDFYKNITKVPNDLDHEEIKKAKEALKEAMENISSKLKDFQVHANLDTNETINLLYT